MSYLLVIVALARMFNYNTKDSFFYYVPNILSNFNILNISTHIIFYTTVTIAISEQYLISSLQK